MKTYLFTTESCPKCPEAKDWFKKMKIEHESINAEEETELVIKYGVMSVPTIVLEDEDNFETYSFNEFKNGLEK